MLISKNSQLGLRVSDPATCIKLLECMQEDYKLAIKFIDIVHEKGVRKSETLLSVPLDSESEGLFIKQLFEQSDVRRQITQKTEAQEITTDEGSKYFFICESVYKAAELVKIGNAFTGRTMKGVRPGKYTYLMGKNEMIRFVSYENVICGFYWNTEKTFAFEWGIGRLDYSRKYFSYPTFRRLVTKDGL